MRIGNYFSISQTRSKDFIYYYWGKGVGDCAEQEGKVYMDVK